MPAAEVEGAKATAARVAAALHRQVAPAPAQATEFGFRYAAMRTPIVDAETHDYIRTTLFIAPFTVLIPPNDQYKLAQMLVPIDDTNTMFYWVAWHETKGIARMSGATFCARAGRRRSRCELSQGAHARQPLPAGPRRR